MRFHKASIRYRSCLKSGKILSAFETIHKLTGKIDYSKSKCSYLDEKQVTRPIASLKILFRSV